MKTIMALVPSCFCCSLVLASGFFSVYLLIAYLIAFAFELLWILESSVALPAAAVFLCAGYFTMALFAAVLIHGLATKNTLCLVAWMFAVTILTFPEAGMVIYMSIQYWRIETLYGVTELASWLIRIIVNVVELMLIQSLYTSWKDEELVMKRLRDLSATAIPIPRDTLHPLNTHQFYQNNAYDHSMDQITNELQRTGSNPNLWNGGIPNNLASQLQFDGYQFCTTQSEFNASIFMPNFIGNNDQQLLTSKKAQSLMDLRFLDNDSSTFVDEKSLGQHHYPNQNMPLSLSDNGSAIISHNYNLTLDGGRNLRSGVLGRGLAKYASVDALNDADKNGGYIIKIRSGFYAQPIANYGVPIYYGPLDGPDFLIYKKQVDKLTSKNSLSNTSTDDVQKYRDVAL